MDEIEILQNKIRDMEAAQQLYEQSLYGLLNQVKMLSESIADVSGLNAMLMIQHNNLRFELGDKRYQDPDFFYPHIVDADTTVQKIVEQKKSIARFGDGEFAIMCGHERAAFQQMDKKLQKRLIEVLESDIPNLMIGIADNYGNLDRYTELAAAGIRGYLQITVRREHMSLLSRDRTYYDAYMTRPYMIYKDKKTDAPRKRFQHLRQIWDKRNVLMVEGTQTRLGVRNDLFDNCLSMRRILIPARNAFECYEDILQTTMENVRDDDLVLVAAGPSAGVLVYDLALRGIQAIDAGHIDIEYEWFLRGAEEREPIPYKYTNEVPGQEEAEEVVDSVYESQIIARCIL